jgi:hypothetical protein
MQNEMPLVEIPAERNSRHSLTTAHAALASIAAILFPLAAILLRALSWLEGLPPVVHDRPVTIHAGIMWTAYLLYLIGIVTGIVLLAGSFKAGCRSIDVHAILGFVVTALLLMQPWIGWYAHVLWARLTDMDLPSGNVSGGVARHQEVRRRWLAQWHVWAGRAIVLGALINGGLGEYSQLGWRARRWS